MPWQALQNVPDQVKTHKGAALTLAQANWVAAVADELAARDDVDDPWAVAWERFEQAYTKQDGAWAKQQSQEEATMREDTIIHVRTSEAWHGLSAEEVQDRVYSAMNDRWPRPSAADGVAFEDRPPRPYLRDLYEDYAIIELGDDYWRYGYSVDPDTQDVTLAATGVEVAQEWVTVGQAGEAEGRRDTQTVRVHEFWPVGSIEATEQKDVWRVQFLAHGRTQDGARYYPANTLEAAAEANVFEGSRMFWNHADEADQRRGYRDARDFCAVLKNVTETGGNLTGMAHIVDPDLNAKMQHEEFRAAIGLSHDSRITYYTKRIDGEAVDSVESIQHCYSVDWVPEGNAGGRVLEAAQTDEESEDMKIEELDLDTLASERPDIVEAIEARAREAAQEDDTAAEDAQAEDETTPENADAAPGEQQEAAMDNDLDPRVQEAINAAVAPLQTENKELRDQLGAVRQERAAEQCLTVIRNMVAEETGITEASRKRIVRQFEGIVVPAAEISAKVEAAVADAQEYEMEALQECAPGTQVRHVGESASAADAQENFEDNFRAQLRAEGKTEDQIEAYMKAR